MKRGSLAEVGVRFAGLYGLVFRVLAWLLDGLAEAMHAAADVMEAHVERVERVDA